jgi:hypothetical protein
MTKPVKIATSVETANPPPINDGLPRAALEVLLDEEPDEEPDEEVDVLLASSEMPEGLEPSVKLEPHCDCKDDATAEAWVGDSWFTRL